MSTPPEILNVVATARFGKRLDLQRLERRLAPLPVTYQPNVFVAARVRVNGTTISFFPNGKAVASGGRSRMAIMAAFAVVARRMRTRVRRFTVVNMCAKWTTARRSDMREVQRITNPSAYVIISPGGVVVCMGVTNRADLKRVHALIH